MVQLTGAFHAGLMDGNGWVAGMIMKHPKIVDHENNYENEQGFTMGFTMGIGLTYSLITGFKMEIGLTYS